MTEAELKEIREAQCPQGKCTCPARECEDAHALLAHIDALAAQVERLKAHMAECDRQEILRVSSLRDLVREAGEYVTDWKAYQCECSGQGDICDSCRQADAWLEKARR